MPRAQGCAGAAQLKTPYRDGTTHVVFEPLDLMAHIPVCHPTGDPRPRVNLTRYHEVFAPNGKHRASVTPAKRDKGAKRKVSDEVEEKTPAACRAAITWAHQE